ncbi:MAG: type III-B CRISPR module-associated protein Cmr5 [Candidatus Rokuibacteriota bacterium]
MTGGELERARHIHGWVSRLDPRLQSKCGDRLKGAPAQMMDNGLLQTLAFFNAKGGEDDGADRGRGRRRNEYGLIADAVVDWLRERKLLRPDGSALQAIAGLSGPQYRRCSEEAIAWLNWAKRLALARVAMEEESGSAEDVRAPARGGRS